jgi:hypothetical protein
VGSQEGSPRFPSGFRDPGDYRDSRQVQGQPFHVGQSSSVTSLPRSSRYTPRFSVPQKPQTRKIVTRTENDRAAEEHRAASRRPPGGTKPCPDATRTRAAETSGSCSSVAPSPAHFRVRPAAQPLSDLRSPAVVPYSSPSQSTPNGLNRVWERTISTPVGRAVEPGQEVVNASPSCRRAVPGTQAGTGR